MNRIEEMWAHLAFLFNELNATNGWGQEHGPDWTFGDVPYHLAYLNRDVIIRGLELGPDLPEADQTLLTNPKEVNAWNDHRFTRRPADQTVTQSLAQWRASCEEIRTLASQMDDAHLERPFWIPAYMGWVTARDGLALCYIHDWSHFTQLRIQMGRTEPRPSAAITRGYLSAMLNLMTRFLNRDAAGGREFSVVMAFTDPDVGAWTIHVGKGRATVSDGRAADADLIITQSAETFEKSLQRMHDPVEAIESGQIQVSNFESLGTFGELFPM
ncbi:MAG: DinB family protein [Candidatus Promineifilaceae bacterium]|nr:DinB family protein [Candidatus Promineifilaceae bacterium]